MLTLPVKSKRRPYLAALLVSSLVLPSAAVVSDRLANAASSGPTTVVLEAEDATHNLGIGSGAGATGRGALGYWSSAGGFVRFNLSTPDAGSYRIALRHASAWDQPSTRTMTVDGRDTGIITFPSTGGWGNWTTTTVTLPLTAGTHTFELSYRPSDWGAVDLDNITVSLETPANSAASTPDTTTPATAATTTPPAPTTALLPTTTPTTVPTPLQWSPAFSSASPTTVVLEAEDATHNLGIGSGAGATGRGALGYWSSAGGFVRFNLSTPDAGSYRIALRHASAWDQPSTRTMTVDGRDTGIITFPSTGGWGNWTTTTVTLPLTAGTHTFELSYRPSDWGAVDLDNITVSLETPANSAASTPDTTTPATAATTTPPAPTTALLPTTTPIRVAGGPTTVPTTNQPAPAFSIVLEADRATHNVVVETDQGGTNGGSLGYWMTPGGFVRFTVTVPTTAVYRLRARHASAWDADTTRTLLIDGAATTQVVFASSGAWDRWRTTDSSASLTAGTHTIEYRLGSSDWGALNFDTLTIDSFVGAGTPVTATTPTTSATTTTVVPTTTTTSVTVPTTGTSTLIEAEDAAHNLVLETIWNGTGRGSLGYWSAGGFVRFSVNAPVSGTYRFRVKHSSAWDAPATRSVLVDGTRTMQVTFPSSGAWGSWRTTDISIPLAAGGHTLQLLYASGDWGALNIDSASFDLVAAGTIPATTTTTRPTTTTAAAAPNGSVIAGDARMCAGPGSRSVVSTILANQTGWLRGEAGGGVWGMEGVYSVLLNPLEMAINCNDAQMLDSMSYIVMGSAATMSTNGDGRVWLTNGAEIRLVSAEWIYVLSRVITGISAIPAAQRTPNMLAVTQTFVPVVAAHVNRWVFAAPFYGMSGCPYIPGSGHSDYLAVLAAKTLGGAKSFCNGLIDTDLWIMGAGSELLRSAANDPALVRLAALGVNQDSLAGYVRQSGALLRARLIPTNLNKPNGAGAQGLDFDPGVFSDLFSESGYSAYTGTTFPTGANVGTDPRAGWDTSHLQAFVHLVNSLYRSRGIAASSFPTDGEITALANQVAYGMLVNGDTLWPQFSNYFSGWNGWYRVNYSGRAGFGYGPSDLGNTAFMEGAYGLWAAWNPDLAAINARLGVILQATDSTTVNWRTGTYTKSWMDYTHGGTPNLYRTTSPFLLQHVAASVGATW